MQTGIPCASVSGGSGKASVRPFSCRRAIIRQASASRQSSAPAPRGADAATSREVFDRYAGTALIRSGYEPDRDWISRYDLPG